MEVVVRFRGVDVFELEEDRKDVELITAAVEDLVRRHSDVRRFLLDNLEFWVDRVSEV